MPRITEKYGETYTLLELFKRWGIEHLVPGGADAMRMPEGLEVQLVADFHRGGLDPRLMTKFAANGIPLLAPNDEHAGAVLAEVGEDGLDFVRDPRWNEFPRPKVAMVCGAMRPGSSVTGEADLALVDSFEAVLEDPRILNLQMFHREDEWISPPTEEGGEAEAAPDSEEPNLPVLPKKLVWPCPELFKVGRRCVALRWGFRTTASATLTTATSSSPASRHLPTPNPTPNSMQPG